MLGVFMGAATLSITTLAKMANSITTLSIKSLYVTLSISDTQLNNALPLDLVLGFINYYSERHYAKYHYAESHYAECHSAECYYGERHYGERHYAVFHYTKCRGAVFM